MSQAFSLFPVQIDLEAPRPITAPPTANLTPPPESETGRAEYFAERRTCRIIVTFVINSFLLNIHPWHQGTWPASRRLPWPRLRTPDTAPPPPPTQSGLLTSPSRGATHTGSLRKNGHCNLTELTASYFVICLSNCVQSIDWSIMYLCFKHKIGS